MNLKRTSMSKRVVLHVSGVVLVMAFAVAAVWFFVTDRAADAESWGFVEEYLAPPDEPTPEPEPTLDTAAYDAKLRQLAHLDDVPAEPPLWPAEAVYPNYGALLPFNRIIAYYGNFYSRGMGILGQYSEDEVVRRLQLEIDAWNAADPTTPVIPAIDYIAVTAQLSPGADGKYRLRMPDKEIDKAVALAARVNGIVILEVQAGLADLQGEITRLEPYLSLPNVHLAIDPEFAMIKSGQRPGTVVGSVDAAHVNAAAEYLATLVQTHDLPPKIIVVHRYTRAMVTNAADIAPLPEVQIVMDMDGWGPPSQKRATYNAYISPEPVQFTGFKLFYKNDALRPGSRLLTPAEILELMPSPSFIQYQ